MDLLSTCPAAAVFDVDGLLVDTEPCWTMAETELFARRGMPFGDEQKAMLIGRSLPDACAGLASLFGETGPTLEAELMAMVAEVVESSAEPMVGAHGLVEAAMTRAPVAVASNSPRTLLDAALRRGGFEGWFPLALCADDVRNPKPAPDMYLAASAALGVPPERCVAFEDSGTGVRSAQAAGLPCVAVPSLPNVGLEADLVVSSLADPALMEWVRTW